MKNCFKKILTRLKNKQRKHTSRHRKPETQNDNGLQGQTKKHQAVTNANFKLGRFADNQVFPIFVLALTGDRIDASNSQPKVSIKR